MSLQIRRVRASRGARCGGGVLQLLLCVALLLTTTTTATGGLQRRLAGCQPSPSPVAFHFETTAPVAAPRFVQMRGETGGGGQTAHARVPLPIYTDLPPSSSSSLSIGLEAHTHAARRSAAPDAAINQRVLLE
jgi:hypothetical protein